jgi:hypothetical protein
LPSTTIWKWKSWRIDISYPRIRFQTTRCGLLSERGHTSALVAEGAAAAVSFLVHLEETFLNEIWMSTEVMRLTI